MSGILIFNINLSKLLRITLNSSNLTHFRNSFFFAVRIQTTQSVTKILIHFIALELMHIGKYDR